MYEVSRDLETWLPVPEFPDFYEVSDHGRVRSMERSVVWANGGRRTYPGRVLKCSPDSQGYPRVTLGVGTRRKKVYRRVHVLVLSAFVGPRPSGMECLHGDGVRANNVLWNLSWGTPSQNCQDTLRHGHHRGAAKECCCRGHRLAHPNLVPSMLPSRACRACNRALCSYNRAKRLGLPLFDLLERADAQYAQIMS